MNFEYRKIIQGFELSKKEMETLYNAEQLLYEMNEKLDNVDGTEIDKSLKEKIEDALNYIQICNCKLSVHCSLGKD